MVPWFITPTFLQRTSTGPALHLLLADGLFALVRLVQHLLCVAVRKPRLGDSMDSMLDIAIRFFIYVHR